MTHDELLEKIKRQIDYCYEFRFYREMFDRVGIKPQDVKSIDDFWNVPFTTRKDLVDAFKAHSPFGGFFSKDVVRINFTPVPGIGFMPQLFTKHDLQSRAKSVSSWLRAIGVTEDDIVQNTFAYTFYPAGSMFHDAVEEMGAKIIPMGPGNTEEQVRVMNEYGVTVLASNPSFALHIGQAGGKGIRVLAAGGEPFSSIEGYRSRVKEAFGGEIVAADYYGLAEVGRVAAECRNETGLHVFEDFVHVEIIDPESAQPLPDGERGEIVVTSLDKEAFPILRFRTSDLSTIIHFPCVCGKERTLPKGVFGRTDECHKAKGVKLYPSQIAFIFAGFPGLSYKEFQVILTKGPLGADRFTIRVKGAPNAVDRDRLIAKLKKELRIAPDDLEIVEDLKTGPRVIDERF